MQLLENDQNCCSQCMELSNFNFKHFRILKKVSESVFDAEVDFRIWFSLRLTTFHFLDFNVEFKCNSFVSCLVHFHEFVEPTLKTKFSNPSKMWWWSVCANVSFLVVTPNGQSGGGRLRNWNPPFSRSRWYPHSTASLPIAVQRLIHACVGRRTRTRSHWGGRGVVD